MSKWYLSWLLKPNLTRKRAGIRQLFHKRQALIVGTGQQAMKSADAILDSAKLNSNLIGFVDHNRKEMWRYRDIPLIGNFSDVDNIIKDNQIDFIIVAVEPGELLTVVPVMEIAEKMGVSVYLTTQIYSPTIARTRPTRLASMAAIEYSTVHPYGLTVMLKSLVDRIGAFIGIMASSPILLLTCLAIKFDSRGPILFKQTRTGINGRSFKLWKFRTMVVDAEEKKSELQKLNEMSGPVFKIAKDPRITRIGKLLRKYSIDELPQLFNVLRGEMSLVGPRPPLPSEVAKFELWQHRKLSVRPGLTCLWQTNGRNNIDFDEWMKLDLKYIDNWSLWEDAKILLRTIPTVLKGTGT